MIFEVREHNEKKRQAAAKEKTRRTNIGELLNYSPEWPILLNRGGRSSQPFFPAPESGGTADWCCG